MPEKRIDPTDGISYTYGEMLDYYKGKFTKKEIDAFWKTCPKEQTVTAAKWVPKETPASAAKAKAKSGIKSKQLKWKPKVVVEKDFAVEPGKFAWCSLDPVTDKLVVYPGKQCLLLEAALRAGKPEATIMVQPTSMDHSLIATVAFNDPQEGEHTQRTMSGAGERAVRRTDECRVQFGQGKSFLMPQESFVGFGRMAWVSVEPVQGVLQPYTRENAFLIEEKYHVKAREVHVVVSLPTGANLNVCVRFDYQNGNHTQSTGSGLRSVSRISRVSVPQDGVDIPLYRRPEDGSVDSLRYRLEGTEGYNNTPLDQAGTLNIPESAFMDESGLGVDAFSSVRAMEVALGEMGFMTTQLNAVADCMREEPMRLAANVCLDEYRKDHDVALLSIMDKILLAWKDKGIIMKPFPALYVTDCGVSDVNGCFKAKAMHNNRAVYYPSYSRNQTTKIYFDDFWKISRSDSTTTWSFGATQATGEHPPEEGWTASESPERLDADASAASEISFDPPPKIKTGSSEPEIVARVESDTPGFTPAVNALFTAWDADAEALRPLLSSMRGGGKFIDLRRVAAAGLWRTVMQGA